MAVFASCQFPLLADADAMEAVETAVAAREPFSLIRLGDGEAVVLTLGDASTLQDLAYLHGHWGSEGVTLDAIEEVRRDLQTAVEGADIVGVRNDVLDVVVPDDLLERTASEVRDFVRSDFHLRADEIDNLSTGGGRRLALLHRALSTIEWSEHQRFCSAWIHWELLSSGALDRILQGVDAVGLVTSRPELEHLVARRYGIDTSVVLVPDKYVEAPEPGRHVPGRYRTIRSDLAFAPGTVVLVGAGIPGKAYCQWLKEAGCIGIDVGSVLDAWVGKASRPRVLESRFAVAGGDRVPDELQLRLPVSSGGRTLTPRWKPTKASP